MQIFGLKFYACDHQMSNKQQRLFADITNQVENAKLVSLVIVLNKPGPPRFIGEYKDKNQNHSAPLLFLQLDTLTLTPETCAHNPHCWCFLFDNNQSRAIRKSKAPDAEEAGDGQMDDEEYRCLGKKCLVEPGGARWGPVEPGGAHEIAWFLLVLPRTGVRRYPIMKHRESSNIALVPLPVGSKNNNQPPLILPRR